EGSEARRGREAVELDGLADAEGDRGAQAANRVQLVLGLRAAVLADRGGAGEPVAQADRALGLVAVLAAGTRSTVTIDIRFRDQRVVGDQQMIGARHV